MSELCCAIGSVVRPANCGAVSLVGSAWHPPELVGTIRPFLASQAVRVPTVARTSFGVIGVSVTPTLIAVDEAGVVRHVYPGELGGEAEALALLGPAADGATR